MSSVQVELEKALDQGVKDGKVPHAIVYATNKDGSFEYHYSTGLQNCGTDNEPVQEDAFLMLASQTKLLTSVATLQAVEQGVFGLDEDVSEAIPEVWKNGILTGFDEKDNPVLVEKKKALTVRHLITHSSGAPYYLINPNIAKHQLQRGAGGVDQAIAATILERYDNAMSFEPGESWIYGPGLDWIGLLLYRKTGFTLEEWMKKNIFSPLGIKDITFWPGQEVKNKIPHLVTRGKDGKLMPTPGDNLNTRSVDCFGGHGCYARLSEYTKVMRSLLANDGQLLQPSSVREMFTPQLAEGPCAALNGFFHKFAVGLPGEINADVPMQFGLGSVLYEKDDIGRRKKGTLGWNGYYNTFWIIDPQADIAFTFGTQMLPSGDPGAKEMTGIAERAVYKMRESH